MSIKEISFPSYNGRDTIKGWVCTPIREEVEDGIIAFVQSVL